MTQASISPVARRWCEEPPAPAQVVRLSRRQAVFPVLTVMLAFCGVIVGLLSWLRPLPRPYFVPLWITEYESREIPFLPGTRADRDALCQGNYFVQASASALAGQERQQLIQELTALRTRAASDAVVVYLSGRAGCAGRGEVYLLAGDVKIDDVTTRLPLRTVLKLLRDCPARHKLLILDIMWSLTDPWLDVLADDVAAQVPGDLAAVEDPHRLVLCACSPGQVSLASPELRRSVFGYYLEEGLRGWADGWSGRGEHDGQVRVHELAEFVRARVDRWAWRNRHARQTPILLGSGDDFPLIALEHGQPRPHLPIPDPAAYPAVLADAWKLRDRWWAEESYRVAPRMFGQLEATLLAAEWDWRGGLDPARAFANRSYQLERCQERLSRARSLPRPEPRSLGLARAQGRQPNPAVAEALKQLLAKVEATASDGKPGKAAEVQAKLAAEFADKLKGQSPFDLAWAVFERAVADPRPRPETLHFLSQLPEAHDPYPSFVETFYLRRLAVLFPPGSAAQDAAGLELPPPLVHAALEVVRLGEKAAAQERAFSWMRGLLEEAAQKRHDGEVLLAARGYANLDRAAHLLRKAAADYEAILRQEDTILKAQRGRDEALAFLPSYLPYLEVCPHHEATWLAAVQAAGALDVGLAAGTDGVPLAAAEVRQKVEDFRQKAAILQNFLGPLLRPFTADGLAQLISHTRQPDAPPVLVHQMDALLSVPRLKASDRIALWNARQALARRLLDETRRIDQDEDGPHQQTPVLATVPQPDRYLARTDPEGTARRCRWAIALLCLAGLDLAEVRHLEEAQARALLGGPDPNAVAALAGAVRRAWIEQLPAQLRGAADWAARDRLARVFPPFVFAPLLDDPQANPAAELRAQEARALWAWLADRDRYEGRRPGGADFHARAARDYQCLAGPVPEETYVEFTANADALQLTPAHSAAAVTLQPRLVAPPGLEPAVAFDVVTAGDDWLRISPDLSELPRLRTAGAPVRECQVPVRVELLPGAGHPVRPRPLGFLVQVRVQNRTFYHPVAVDLVSAAERPQLLLSADPKEPTAPSGDLRLRPVKARQPFYLYARNPTGRARNVLVQLAVNDAVLPGCETKLAVGAQETRRVAFPPVPPAAAPAPGGDLPELTGPLQLRLLDADNPKVILDAKAVRVSVASPREYVEVTDIHFTPASLPDRKNQLAVQLRARAPLADPPCLAELVLPAERIPGLVAAKEGTFRGVLPMSGGALASRVGDLKLSADNLHLAEGVPEQGWFYLTIDGCERAFLFRTTFARRGAPTAPQEDDQPAVRLRADHHTLAGPHFTFAVEVDNAPPGAILEVRLGRMHTGAFEPEVVQKLPSARRRHVGFSPHGPDGSLLFEAAIQDWTVVLDTSGILGERELQARLLDGEGHEVRMASQRVVLQDSPPERVQLIDLPRQAPPGTLLPVRATGTDHVSGIREVRFFLGKPVAGQVPAETPTFSGTPADGNRALWSARVPLPAARKGPVEVSVQFRNGVGLSTFATGQVELSASGDVAAAKPAPGHIRGRVLEGPRPQAELEVVLKDTKGAEKAKTATRADGSFAFEDVPPGKYQVSTHKPLSQRKGEMPVQVEAEKTAAVTLELFLE
jgi:hypothetical protein